jgi:hyaluronan synthase
MIAALDTIITTMRYPIGYATLALLAVFTFDDPMTFLRFLSGVGIMAMLNMLYYLRIERSWNFLFGIFYAYFSVFTLFWIFPYALFTLRSRSWLTR